MGIIPEPERENSNVAQPPRLFTVTPKGPIACHLGYKCAFWGLLGLCFVLVGVQLLLWRTCPPPSSGHSGGSSQHRGVCSDWNPPAQAPSDTTEATEPLGRAFVVHHRLARGAATAMIVMGGVLVAFASYTYACRGGNLSHESTV